MANKNGGARSATRLLRSPMRSPCGSKGATPFALAVFLATAMAACPRHSDQTAENQSRITPLLKGLGSHTHPVTTRSPLAQRYFDQGLNLTYAFNHAEAVRSFRQAALLDPDCAMAYWGPGVDTWSEYQRPHDAGTWRPGI